jgi:hypothetical protein
MKILLTIMPYWDPMIPPMGISSLKAYLKSLGYSVKMVDYIVDTDCLDFYYNYFDILKKSIPEQNKGNFRNIGHDVLQSQMMAHQNVDNSNVEDYYKLISALIYNHFYIYPDQQIVLELAGIVDVFYQMLEAKFTILLEEYKPDIIGCTVYKCTLPATIFAAKIAKKINPKIKILVGGGTFNESHAPDSPNFDRLIKYTEGIIDHVFLGQGELLLKKYLEGGLPREQKVYTKADVDDEIIEFHDAILPDLSDLDISKYPFLAATSSAGCIYDCSFCVSKKINPKYRVKESKKVVQEMTELYQKYKNQLFFMTDSLINPVVTDLANAFIESNVSLYYDAYFKVDKDAKDINKTLLWRRGGLYRVRLGAESGSQKILNEMNKGITVQQTKECLSALAYAGIKTTTYWVIGHPGETEEDFQATLDLIEEMKNDIYQAECNYFLYHYSKQGKEDEWSRNRQLIYPKEATKLLVFEYYTLNMYPLREETFKRVHRFEAHCRKLGIPNPYSLTEHYEADKRWQGLHKNAVPGMKDFLGKSKYINECKNIANVNFASRRNDEIEIFNF